MVDRVSVVETPMHSADRSAIQIAPALAVPGTQIPDAYTGASEGRAVTDRASNPPDFAGTEIDGRICSH